MRRAARRDENESNIVKALRNRGAKVWFLDEPCDLLISYKGETLLFEIKDGNKVPSKRKLTNNEQNFFDTWTGGILAVIENVDQALEILDGIDKI